MSKFRLLLRRGRYALLIKTGKMIQRSENKRYGGNTENGIVRNKPSILFPSFRRCLYYRTQDGYCRRFRLHLPQDRTGKHPLVIYLHGADGPGFDNTKHMILFRNAWKRLKKHKECIVIAPQIDVFCGYNTDLHTQILKELVSCVREHCDVDSSRIYLVGTSYGGYGAIYEVLRNPNRYAAVVDVVGWYYYNVASAPSQSELPDRFHGVMGDNEFAVLAKTPFRLACSKFELLYIQHLYKKLRQYGGDVELYRNDKHGHMMCRAYYRNQAWDDWMLSQKKTQGTPELTDELKNEHQN